MLSWRLLFLCAKLDRNGAPGPPRSLHDRSVPWLRRIQHSPRGSTHSITKYGSWFAQLAMGVSALEDAHSYSSGRLAVKVVYSLVGTDSDDEITIMRDLRHPNILQFVQVWRVYSIHAFL